MNRNKPEVFEFTRESFYEKVWSSPATHLARDLGCSDVMIGKVCKDHKIPKPYLGYWAKLQHNKKAKKTPLPKCDDPKLQKLVFHKYPQVETMTPALKLDADLQSIMDKAQCMPPMRVRTQLGKPHPHVEATRQSLSRHVAPLTPRDWARQEHKHPTIQVEVSKALRTRALCILDAFIRSIEKIGGRITQKSERYYDRSVQILEVELAGESLGSFRIREQQKRVTIPEAKREYRFSPTSELVNTGLLAMRVGPTYGEIYIRDSATSFIEDNLHNLILKLAKQAALIRQRRVHREEQVRRQEEKARIRFEQEQELTRRREDLKKRQNIEQRKIDRLLSDVKHRQLSKEIRGYLDEVWAMNMMRDNATSIQVDCEAAEYFRWAYQQADRFDPLKDSPPSVLDEQI